MILIDGDIIAYRCAFGSKNQRLVEALDAVDELILYILDECSFKTGNKDHKIYLTGGGNFRNEFAKTAVYKGNRKSAEKPAHLADIREHLQEVWWAEVSMGEEADDLIAKAATEFGEDGVIASVDKDMLQIPAYHFNITKATWKKVREQDGLHYFYTQILTGDSADNIVGLYNIGPKKAEKILDGASTEEELWDKAIKAYEGDEDRVVENARLLWLRRYEGEIWQPPHMR